MYVTPLRACPCESTAGSGDDRSGTEGTSPATHATVPPCRAPKAHRSTRHGARATDDRGYPRDEPDEARFDQHPLFFSLLSTSSHHRTRTRSEHNQNATNQNAWVFMRLVLGLDFGVVVVYARSVIFGSLQRGVPFTSSNNPSCMCDVTNR